jgi:hypothetical protein
MLLKTILMMSLIAVAAAAEKKIKMEDMPAAVQQAVKDQSKGAVIRGFAQEVESGKTLYEMQLTVDGHAKDVTFDGAGKVVSVEEEVPLESIAVPAREAIQKAVERASCRRWNRSLRTGAAFTKQASGKRESPRSSKSTPTARL